LWRHNVSGDLPHTEQIIDWIALFDIMQANQGKHGFTYTHHRVIGSDIVASENRDSIARANMVGFTINLSADTLAQADALKALNIGPVVCIVPENHPQHSTTPAGNPIVICPAVTRDDVTCASCGLCAVATRRSIIGFPVHGTGKRKADNVFKGIAVSTIKG
jgi:hypothetical protein